MLPPIFMSALVIGTVSALVSLATSNIVIKGALMGGVSAWCYRQIVMKKYRK